MQVLYREDQSDCIVFGRKYRNICHIRRSIWMYRLGAVAILLLIYILNYIIDFNYWWSTFSLSSLFFYLVIISYSEGKEYRSASPIIIDREGIQLHSSRLQRLLGYDGYVPKDDIRSITILRSYTILESRMTGKKMKYYRWRDVPAEFIINTVNGKKYRTGMKHPDKLTVMVEIMRNEWNKPVLDKHGSYISKINFEPGREERT